MSFRLQSALLRASFRLKFGGRLPPNPALPAFLNTRAKHALDAGLATPCRAAR